MKNFDGIIFDIDGTLTATNNLIFATFNHVTEKYLGRTYTPKEITALLKLTFWIISVSRALKYASPFISKISLMEHCSISTIRLSKSINSLDSVFANFFPKLLFPEAIKPTKNILSKLIKKYKR